MDEDHVLDLDARREAALDDALRNDWPSEPPEEYGKVVELRNSAAPAVVDTGGGGPDVPTLLLTVEEAARMLRCGRTMVYSLIRSKQLRTFKIGALRRVSLADVEEYVDRKVGEVPPTAWSAPTRRTRGGGASSLPPNWPTPRVSEQ